MGIAEGIILTLVLFGIGSLVYLSRGRSKVMGYHDIPTPKVNEVTHGHEGGHL